jgi:hypothetical protein
MAISLYFLFLDDRPVSAGCIVWHGCFCNPVTIYPACMKTLSLSFVFVLTTLCLPVLAQRYWVGSSLYQNNFLSASDLAQWSLVEDNGTGSWTLTSYGSAVVKVDNAGGGYAVRLFNVNGGSPRLLALDKVNGVVDFQVLAVTGGTQWFYLQAQEYNAGGTLLNERDLTAPASTAGYYTVNLSSIAWLAATTQVRFMLVAVNASSQQGTVEFNYVSYSNTSKNWSNTANWSATSGGTGGASVPATGENVFFNGASGKNGLCFLTAPVTVGELTINGYTGTIDLRGSSLTTTGRSTYTTGTITNTNGGSGLVLNASATNVYNTFNGTVFRVGITGTTGRVFFEAANFFNDIDIIRTGSANDDGDGGNEFFGDVTLTNTGTGRMRLATLTGDIYHGSVALVRTAGFLQFAQVGNTVVEGDLSTNTSSTNLTVGSGGGTLTLGGRQAQTISRTVGTLAPTIPRLVLNKPAGAVTLATPVTISDDATFVSGIMNTTTTNPLIFNSYTTATGASDASHVDGPVRKALGLLDNFTFPVGDAGFYRPAGISTLLGGTYVAQYVKALHPFGTAKESGLTTVSTCEYWMVDQLSGFDASLTLTWRSAVCSSHGYVTVPSAIRVARWSGSAWQTMPLDAGSVSGNSTAGSVSTLALGTFGNAFTLGSLSPANPLPVTWTSFQGVLHDGQAALTWETASERNSAFFEVQRAENGKDYTAIDTVAASGTTTEKHTYAFTDPEVLTESMYYRLRQVDHDGEESYSDVVQVRLPSEHDVVPLRVYPNPATTPVVHLNKRTAVTVTNALGRVVYSAEAVQEIDTSGWPAGVYYIAETRRRGVLLVVP